MRRAPILVDPLVDCVFKALLGDPANQDLLLHFLNGVLRPTVPIVAVTIMNPYNPKEFVGDKETIVDIRATDIAGLVYQIELQVLIRAALRERILYTWAHVYHGQIGESDPYTKLKTACSIWIVDGMLFREQPGFHHRFAVIDPRTGLILSPQLDNHVLELRKLKPLRRSVAAPLDAEARWLYFLKEGRRWATLPAALQSPEMNKAISVLERFSDAKRDLALYQSRADFLHVQRTQEVEDEEKAERMARLEADNSKLEAEKSKLEADKGKLEADKSRLKAELEREQADKERLMKLLLAAGIDPDASSN